VTFAPGDASTGDGVLDVAARYLGVQETAPNRGPMIDEWARFCFLDPEKQAYSWCASFGSWVCHQAGMFAVRRSPSVFRWQQANAGLEVQEPEPGDVLLMLKPSGKGHFGFFYRNLDNGIVESIEGNTNGQGSTNGDRVAWQKRPRSYWNAGIYRPRKQ
jgi:hypothetical protein